MNDSRIALPSDADGNADRLVPVGFPITVGGRLPNFEIVLKSVFLHQTGAGSDRSVRPNGDPVIEDDGAAIVNDAVAVGRSEKNGKIVQIARHPERWRIAFEAGLERCIVGDGIAFLILPFRGLVEIIDGDPDQNDKSDHDQEIDHNIIHLRCAYICRLNEMADGKSGTSDRKHPFVTSKVGKAYQDTESIQRANSGEGSKITATVTTQEERKLTGQTDMTLKPGKEAATVERPTAPSNREPGLLGNYGAYGLYGSSGSRDPPNSERRFPERPYPTDYSGQWRIDGDGNRIPVEVEDDDARLDQPREDETEEGPRDFSKGVTFGARLLAASLVALIIFAICFAIMWVSVEIYEDYSEDTGAPSFAAVFLGTLVSLMALAYSVALASETIPHRRNLIVGLFILYGVFLASWHINLSVKAEFYKKSSLDRIHGTAYIVLVIAVVVSLMVLVWSSCRSGLLLLLIPLIWNVILLYFWIYI